MEEETGNPYVGPKAFTTKQQNIFFGRDHEATELLSLVITERLVLFYAQSGAGKSSLINARLIPWLAERDFIVLPVGRVGGELPMSTESVENVFTFNLLLSLVKNFKELERLGQMSIAEFMSGLTTDDGEKFYFDETPADPETAVQSPPHVLIIDQFEEFFTSFPHHWKDRQDFFRQLDEALAADPLLWLVLALREDYAAALDPFAPLVVGHLRARYYMRRMGLDAALEAVRKPAEKGGRSFKPNVAEELVRSLSLIRVQGVDEPQPGESVEPVQLQVVCYQMWESLKAKKSRSITHKDVQTLGNVDEALCDFYQEALKEVLEANPELSEITLRSWFERDLITEAKTRGTVFEGNLEKAGLSTQVARSLVDHFILRRESRAAGTWYELAHDRFIDPILDSNHAWWRRAPLLSDVRLWIEAGKPDRRLYRGQQLVEALGLHPSLFQDPLVARFLEKSRVWDAAQTALEARERKRDLSETGWGVIFAQSANPAIREALSELLEHRRAQATRGGRSRYREFLGSEGYQGPEDDKPGETAGQFLNRHGVGLGDSSPERVPYYLLLIGDPEAIPFTFQYQLGVKHAVGRIYFDSLQEYTQYARSVVYAERDAPPLPKNVAIFCPTHLGDFLTNKLQENLTRPIVDHLSQKWSDWQITQIIGPEAKKPLLKEVLGGLETPAFLLVTSHGTKMPFKPDYSDQLEKQGGLICAESPEPRAWGRIEEPPPGFYLSAGDIDDNARLAGLIAFLLASFSAGTPRNSDFVARRIDKDSQEPEQLAPQAFIARLPQRLLSHPAGGALAVIGHVDNVLTYSFMDTAGRPRQEAWFSFFARLLDGYPVGSAVEFFNQRYLEYASEWAALIQQQRAGQSIAPYDLSSAELAMNDVRNLIVLGDPAVHLMCSGSATDRLRPSVPPATGTKNL